MSRSRRAMDNQRHAAVTKQISQRIDDFQNKDPESGPDDSWWGLEMGGPVQMVWTARSRKRRGKWSIDPTLTWGGINPKNESGVKAVEQNHRNKSLYTQKGSTDPSR